jgi:hypothetical protein
MFTSDGRLREEFERELSAPKSVAETGAQPVEEPQPDPPEVENGPAPAPDPVRESVAAAGSGALPASAPADPPQGLLELVEFLAGWTLACLGEVPRPDGRLERDLNAARFYIDLIGALHERWGQRLGAEELRFLEGYLDQLRLRYVSQSG